MTQEFSRRFMRFPEVKHKSGMGKTAIYEQMKAGDFPKPYVLGPRARGWASDEIEAWIQSRSRVSLQDSRADDESRGETGAMKHDSKKEIRTKRRVSNSDSTTLAMRAVPDARLSWRESCED